MQSLSKKEWKLLGLQITQIRHPKSVAGGQTDERADGRSGHTTRPAFANLKATQVKTYICYMAYVKYLVDSFPKKLAIH